MIAGGALVSARVLRLGLCRVGPQPCGAGELGAEASAQGGGIQGGEVVDSPGMSQLSSSPTEAVGPEQLAGSKGSLGLLGGGGGGGGGVDDAERLTLNCASS